jgi:hypothetical protein
MIVNATHVYSQPIATVFAAFTDRAFYTDKFAGVGARNVRIVSEERSDDGYSIVTEREVPLEVPAVLKSFLGEWNSIRQHERWEDVGGEYVNELEIAAAGVPVDLRGSMLLRPQGDGCVNDVQMEITCNVPLVGGKLAEFVARNTEQGLVDEYEFIRGWLERNA